MGWVEGLARLKTLSRAKVQQDGRELAFSGIVFERLMVPPTGSGRSICLGPRWSLFLWREGPRPERVVFAGGEFDRALSPGGVCAEVNFSDPAPVVVRYPPELGVEEPARMSGSGRGEITPGLDDGPCEFLSRADAAALYQSTGVSCRRTRHRVHFQSSLHPVAISGNAAAGLPGPGLMRLEVPWVEVLGVRYTVDCALPQAAEMCRERPS